MSLVLDDSQYSGESQSEEVTERILERELFAKTVLAAGWHYVDPGNEASSAQGNDLELEIKKLQEALNIFHAKAEAAELVRRGQSINSSVTSLDGNSARNSRPTNLSLEAQSQDKASITSPLFSSLYTNSHASTPFTTPGEDRSIASSVKSHSSLSGGSSDPLNNPASSKSVSIASDELLKVKESHSFDVEFLEEDSTMAHTSQADIINTLVGAFPELIEAPTRMYGPNNEPLPPTKQEEIDDTERQARRDAIRLQYMGSVPHSLLKISLLLETRNIIWRKVPGLSSAQQRPVAQDLDKTIMNPWLIPLNFGDIDMEDMIGKKLRKTYKVSHSEKMGKCDHCSGNKVEPCRKCNGSPPDDCWWCKSSGKTSGEVCKQCSGTGKLQCRSCEGSVAICCSSCQGQGRNLFAAFLQVSMTRCDLDPVPLSSFVKEQYGRSIEDTCKEHTKDAVTTFVEALSQTKDKDKNVSRHNRAHRVVAILHKSVSYLIQLDVPKQGKVAKKKDITSPTLRPTGIFQRKLQYTSVYFLVPSDHSLGPVQLSFEETQATIKETTKK